MLKIKIPKKLPPVTKFNLYIAYFLQLLGLLFAIFVPLTLLFNVITQGLRDFEIIDPFVIITYCMPLIPAILFFGIGYGMKKNIYNTLSYQKAQREEEERLKAYKEKSVFNKRKVQTS